MTQSISDLTSLHNQTALITGAAKGIGKAIAERFAEAGATLYLVDIDGEALEETVKNINETYEVKASSHVVDLLDFEAIAKLWDSLEHSPDILVNNAAVFIPKKFTQVTVGDIHRTFDLNVRSVMLMCREMIEKRGKQGGTIINIGSIESHMALNPHMVIYGASKAAVGGITRGLTRDYPHFKVNTLTPGGVNTPGALHLGLAALGRLDFGIVADGIRFKSRLPYGKVGQPDHIARAALFLATPLSEYIRGTELVVDGGFCAV